MDQITLTSLEIDGNKVDIPQGLSELFSTVWVSKHKETKHINHYNRTVIKKDKHYVTFLTKKNKGDYYG